MFDLFLPQTPLRALRLSEIILVFISRKGAKNAKSFNVAFVITPNTFAYFAPQRDLFVFISRGGAEAAENFNVYFVITTNSFASLLSHIRVIPAKAGIQ
jgi:hypothetical protein